MERERSYLRLGRITAVIAVVAVVVSLPMSGQQGSRVTVKVHTESGVPIDGARVRIEPSAKPVVECPVTSNGTVDFASLGPGTYQILVTSQGFEPSSQAFVLTSTQRDLEVDFTLVPTLEVKQSIEVRASTRPELEQTSTSANELHRDEVKFLPARPATVVDTLPLIPGITRTPDGEIQIGGTGEHRSALVVNATDVADPATGRFGSAVPVDSVESIDVFKTPFLAQYGRFTSGVVSVETRRGGEKWRFELNDPFPDFRIRSWRLRGLRDISPRANFGGPLIANNLFFSEGFEYSIVKTPVRTLPFPLNESKTESVNSFSQFDYIFSEKHFVSDTLHITPRHTDFVDPQFFNPQPVAPSFRGFDRAWTLIDHSSVQDIAWGLLSLPWKMQLAPVFEYRNGFPYALVDAARNYVGLPNNDRFRFPNFLSIDARVLKDFKVSPEYTLRFSVSGFNLTNHFNALDVHSNIADPQAGVFFGNYKRRFRADFDVIF